MWEARLPNASKLYRIGLMELLVFASWVSTGTLLRSE